jgi:hypothetical protein
LWREQSIWSLTANRMKREIRRARSISLALVVTAAVMGALAGVLVKSTPIVGRVLIGLAAFAMASLPLLRPGWSGTRLRDWTRARSVSEALKSEVSLWLAKAGEYADDTDASRLAERSAAVRADGSDLLRYRIGITAEDRELPPITDLPSYFDVRVGQQIQPYYRARAARLQTALRRFRTAEISLALVGAALGAAAAATAGTTLIPWIAVITTITTALAVHVAATRYEFQLIEFLRTADRLEQLRAKAAVAPAELDKLALAAEHVISIENEAWMAKLAEEPPVH